MFQNIDISTDQFIGSGWKQVIENAEKKLDSHYCTLFADARIKAQNEGNIIDQEIFTLLGAACSMYLDFSSKESPFSPMAVFSDRRSPILTDFSNKQVFQFSEWLDYIDDHELKARLADICWVRLSKHKIGRIAFYSYLNSARSLLSTNQSEEDHQEISWVYAIKRIERATQIAASLGKKNNEFVNSISYIEEVLDQRRNEDSSFFCYDLMEILLKYKRGDPQKYIELSSAIAKKNENKKEFHKSRKYWEIAGQWSAILHNKDLEKEMMIRVAETHEQEAKLSLSLTPPQYITASIHLENAIQAFRAIGGMKERVEILHKELLQYQSKINDEMTSFQTSIDLSNPAEESINRVKGKSFQEAIKILALGISSPKIEELRTRVIELAREFPLQFLVTSSAVNDKGKVIAKSPSLNQNNDQEIGIIAQMFSQACLSQDLAVMGIIEPIRNQINVENPNLRIEDFSFLVNHNPFIPHNREIIYARGLYEGVKGDFLVSTSLLIPQFENSIRYIFEQNKIITSSLDQNGIQKELSLNDLLNKPEANTIFGDDLLFDIKGLLTEVDGSNFRNLVSHGLINHDSFFSGRSIYFWWLSLRLIYISLLVVNQTKKNNNNKSDHQEQSE
jgi:hypothetical protein